jgi:hypothetical protein
LCRDGIADFSLGIWATSRISPKDKCSIWVSGLRYQEVADKPYRFLLNNAIPKSVFDGKEQEGYVIADYPVLESIQGSSTAH